jgi:hypothetical protein
MKAYYKQKPSSLFIRYYSVSKRVQICDLAETLWDQEFKAKPIWCKNQSHTWSIPAKCKISLAGCTVWIPRISSSNHLAADYRSIITCQEELKGSGDFPHRCEKLFSGGNCFRIINRGLPCRSSIRYTPHHDVHTLPAKHAM